MADIFLSYSRGDERRAAQVAALFGELGWTVFWDRRIAAGASWDEVIEHELRQCSCVVVLWSAASAVSQWVKTEARVGVQRRVLVPARLDDTEPPLEFRFVESADLRHWSGGRDDPELSVLLDGIAHHINSLRDESGVDKAAAPVRASDSWLRKRRLWIVSAATGLAAAVAITASSMRQPAPAHPTSSEAAPTPRTDGNAAPESSQSSPRASSLSITVQTALLSAVERTQFKTHQITARVVAQDGALPRIDRVVYLLPPSFGISAVTRSTAEDGFALTMGAAGRFLLQAKVYLTDGTVRDLSKPIDLRAP